MIYRVFFLRFALMFVATVLVLLCRCIERKNPWDPINGCPEGILTEIRTESSFELKKNANQALHIDSTIVQYWAIFDSLKKVNEHLLVLVNDKKNSLDSVQWLNDRIDSVNTTNDCKNLSYKTSFEFIPYLLVPLSLLESEVIRESLIQDSSTVDSIIMNANTECAPHNVYSTNYYDSIILRYESLIRNINVIIDELNKYNSIVDVYNKDIRSSNERYIEIHNAIQNYNDSIDRVISYCEKPWVSDPVKIKDSILTLKPGDTLYLDSGVLTFEFRLNEKGDDTRPIIIEGSPFKNTVFEHVDAFVSGCNNIIIRNIVFSKGAHQNISIENKSRNITFENCYFIGSKGPGVVITESDVILRNCVVAHNLKGGIICKNNNARLTADNVLIVKNGTNGVFSEVSEIYIKNGTISDNRGVGIYLQNQKRPVTILNSLITYNETFGLARERSEDLNKTVFLNCSIIGNVSGDFSVDSNKVEIDSSCVNAHPMYVDKDNENYLIGANSELYGKNWGFIP